jgi:FkbM family methyltransferase
MIFASLPNPAEAVALLQQIADRPPKMAARVIDKPLVLYGAGELGKMALHLLETIGQPPLMIVDAQADYHRNTAFWKDKNLVAPNEVPKDLQEEALLAVTISTLPYSDLAITLSDAGWRDIVPFYDIAEAYRDRYPLSNGWVLDRFDEHDLLKTREVLLRWDDDVSRAHHLQFLAWHRFREDWRFTGAPVTTHDRYFIPEAMPAIRKAKNFLDVGAHHGNVTRRFMEIQPNFEKIWMVEPDAINRQVINEWRETLPIALKNKIIVSPFALAADSGLKSFAGGYGYASQFNETGQELIATNTLDEMDLSVDFMKLHLEGAELAVLKGAENIIKNKKPIIVLTAYHNDLGVWKIADWLMQVLFVTKVHYVFLFRLHSWAGTGAVIYPVPLREF